LVLSSLSSPRRFREEYRPSGTSDVQDVVRPDSFEVPKKLARPEKELPHGAALHGEQFVEGDVGRQVDALA
jgi:hypothetical protein